MDKIKVKYSPQSITNAAGDTRTYARIVERTTYSVDQLVQYALDNGQVVGQFEVMKGQFNGFLAAIKAVLEMGAAVNCGWFRIETTIKGQLDENRQLTSENTLKTSLTALQDLKLDISNFSFTNVENPENVVKITSIMSDGAAKGTIVKDTSFNIFGKNLFYVAAYGDKVELTYDGLETPIALTPIKSDYAHMNFAFPTAISELEDDTPLLITCTLHGGVEGSQAQTRTVAAIYKTGA